MLGHLGKALDVAADVFRRRVVVVENRAYVVADDVPGLADADVEREEAGEDAKREDVKNVLEELADAEMRLALRLGLGRYGRLVYGWEMLLQNRR